MARFRKKPVEIEAYPTRDVMRGAAKDWSALPDCIIKAYELGNILFLSDAVLIQTLEGRHRADPDDWIIKGVKGELYPCKPDIFEMTYDRIEES